MLGWRAPVASLGAGIGLLGLVLPFAGCRPRQGPSLLIVTVDTLRADALGAYGARPSRTPRLDRFAEESTLFERAAAPMPHTRPSHFSILTSRYPREHGVVNNRIALPESERTLTEILAERGYRTAAFVAVSLLARGSGFEQGFETIQGPRSRHRTAEEVVTEALAWLGTLAPDERFFAWIHLFDPHLPYAPPAEERRGVAPELEASLPSVGWEEIRRAAEENGGDVPPALLDHARELYRGEVAHVDRWVGALLDGFAARSGSLDDILVVITADHGECFEDGFYFHHDCMRDPAIRVPLMIRHPARFPPGARVAAQVSSLDIAPTLLEAVGIEPPPGWAGRPLAARVAAEPRYVLVQYPYYPPGPLTERLEQRDVIKSVAGDPAIPVLVATEQVGLVGADWTYLRARGPDGASEELRAAPSASPGSGAPGEAGASERGRLAALLDEALREHPLRPLGGEPINAELRETLRALGYAE